MQPPPRDANGNVIPHDHNEIEDKDFVIRRISDLQIITDEATGQRRISSKAFKASSGQNSSMSIDIEKLIIEAGQDPVKYVTTPKWIGSLKMLVSPIRTAGCKVGFDPLPENPYHGGIWGNFNRTCQKALRSASEWYVKIDDVNIQE